MTAAPTRAPRKPALNFASVSTAALPSISLVVRRWLADGKLQGCEWVARNPTRADRHLGSFKVNLRTGRWADFATGDKGGGVISLAAYLFDLSQVEAARKVAGMLGIDADRER